MKGWTGSDPSGQAVKRENYDLAYTAPLEPCNSPQAAVEQLYNQFNNDHPADYHHPSMSVSDIVAIKQDGKVSCHYCDSVGFTEIPGFLPDNPLKNAEMMLEDDYGMIDGVINNGRRGEELEKAQEYAERTTPEKPSIRERLEDAKRECAEHKPPEGKKPGRDVPEHDCL